MFDDRQLLRYNRQILLSEVDISGQQRLAKSSLAVIGLGGLGCPAAQYLAAAGVGELLVFDDDTVELNNLQRQLAYQEKDIGRPKVQVMAALLRQLNPNIKITAIEQKFNADEYGALIKHADAVIDATDNIASRKQINVWCVDAGVPLVFAAAIRMEGQLAVFDSRRDDSPCYECVFGHIQLDESCSRSGVLGTVVGTLGLMQATEAIKLLLGLGDSSPGHLRLYDAVSGDWQSIRITANPECPVCGS